MSKFKIGDKVRALKSDGADHEGHYIVGNIYTVTEVYDNGNRIATVDENGGENGWSIKYFELVQDDKLTSLIAKANEGMDALAELSLYHFSAIEFVLAGGTVRPLGSADNYKRVVRLRKKSFKPFETSNGWFVEVDGDSLVIGCKHFNLKKFKEMLIHLTKGATSSITQTSESDFCATRNGILYEFHLLPWQDADKILSALNEMEK